MAISVITLTKDDKKKLTKMQNRVDELVQRLMQAEDDKQTFIEDIVAGEYPDDKDADSAGMVNYKTEVSDCGNFLVLVDVD